MVGRPCFLDIEDRDMGWLTAVGDSVQQYPSFRSSGSTVLEDQARDDSDGLLRCSAERRVCLDGYR